MRLISGRAGGIRLQSPKTDSIRPTTDRVREALFSSLGDISGFNVVDLFSGSGAIGLEAWSRGADVAMVEDDPRAIRLIKKNIATVARAMGDAPMPKIVKNDALKTHLCLPRFQPDFIIADPPYLCKDGPTLGTRLLRNKQFAAWAGDAMLILEQSTRSRPDFTDAHWQIQNEKRYGDIVLLYLSSVLSS